MTRPRRTRIVATLRVPRAGGARPQDDPGCVAHLIGAGADVARINLSHSSAAADLAAGGAPRYDGEEALLRAVRAAAELHGPERHAASLLDLQGVKVRLRLPDAQREEGLALAAGERVRVRITREREPDEVSCDGSDALAESVRAALAVHGELSVAIGDGEPFLRCGAMDRDVAVLRAPEACVLPHGKGVTFRGVHVIGEAALTEKDRVDLAAFVLPALASGEADFVALSFTQSGADVRRLREFCDTAQRFFREGRRPESHEDASILSMVGSVRPDLAARYATMPACRPFVVAKVETSAGAEALDDILGEADAVMVARGDMGLNCAPEDVPFLQKRMIRDARRLGRPAIVATQMLESMLTSPEPRRSEATDAFNAVLDGADALMLSAETATGQRPVEAVATLARIAASAERWESVHPEARETWLRAIEKDIRTRREARRSAPVFAESGAGSPAEDVTDRITAETVRTAETLGCAAVVAATRSGRTARNLARFDPMLPVIAVVPDAGVARSLQLVGSVQAVVAPAATGDGALDAGLARAVSLGWLGPGDRVVVASAQPDDPPGATTALAVRVVPTRA